MRSRHHPLGQREPTLGLCTLAKLMAAGDGVVTEAAVSAGRDAALDPAVLRVAKSAITAGNTSDVAWAGSLVDHQELSAEFVSAYRPRSLIGRLTGLRYVDFQTRTLRSCGVVGAAWVGEARPVPAGQGAFDSVFLTATKIAALAVVTRETARFSSPNNDGVLQQEMLRAVAISEDRAFIDPLASGVDGVSPASVTSTASPINSSGNTPDAINADLAALAKHLADAGSDLVDASWVMHPRTALFLSFLTVNGVRVFPSITAAGGTIAGISVLTSLGVPIVGSPGETSIALIDATRILIADDGVATVDASTHAAVQMDFSPSTGAAQMVSLYQFGLVGVRVVREVNWTVADASAVAILTGVTY